MYTVGSKLQTQKATPILSIDLGTSFFMPQGTSYYVDDVNIANSWYSIEQGMNNKMYFRYKINNGCGG